MRKYLFIFACVAAAFTLTIGIANYLVDPYAISGIELPAQRNALKPAFADRHAYGKPFIAARYQPAAVVFGTSREDHGIDPDYSAWPTARGTCYNLGIDATNINDIDRLFEHVLAFSNVKTIVLGLDFLNMFDANTPTGANLDTSLLASEERPKFWITINSLRYFISFSMLEDSIKTLREQDPKLIEFEPNGRRNSLVFDSAARRLGQGQMFITSERRYFRARINVPASKRYSLIEPDGQSTLRYLGKVLDRAAAHDIDVRIFITPVHARQLEIYRMLDLWTQLENWKRAVAAIAQGDQLRKTHTAFPIWDFADYNEFTTESVPLPGDLTTRMRWYEESSHYTPALGNLVLDRIFERRNSSLPAYFGIAIRSDNIDAHLEGIRRRGESYRATHARDMSELQRNADEAIASGVVVPM